MFNPNYTLLYVDNPLASAAFYTDLLGRAPLQAAPTFALFALDSGLMLGLWSRTTVEPRAQASGGAGLRLHLRRAGPRRPSPARVHGRTVKR